MLKPGTKSWAPVLSPFRIEGLYERVHYGGKYRIAVAGTTVTARAQIFPESDFWERKVMQEGFTLDWETHKNHFYIALLWRDPKTKLWIRSGDLRPASRKEVEKWFKKLSSTIPYVP